MRLKVIPISDEAAEEEGEHDEKRHMPYCNKDEGVSVTVLHSVTEDP
jgi:hypothetical protein